MLLVGCFDVLIVIIINLCCTKLLLCIVLVYSHPCIIFYESSTCLFTMQSTIIIISKKEKYYNAPQLLCLKQDNDLALTATNSFYVIITNSTKSVYQINIRQNYTLDIHMMQLITCIIIETESLNWMHVDYSISNSIIITQ